MVYPMKTVPVFKQYLWGGDSLKRKYNKPIPDGFAAESWEVSCHSDGLCTIAEGEHKGKTLKEVVFSDTQAMLGKSDCNTFPLLVKLLDAKDKLSVQVHPDNDYAFEHENGELGKTEMWYVVDAEPGAKLVYGLKDGTTPEMLKSAVVEGRLEELLNYVPVSKGDSFFIPSGTIHAICEGLLIAEIQQSSNTTYRVYDYNRRDKDGNLRPLHIDKAVEATNYSPAPLSCECNEKSICGGTVKQLAGCEYFTVLKYSCHGEMNVNKNPDKFEMLVCTEGGGEIVCDAGSYSFTGGDSFFVPAAMSGYTVKGKCEFLRSYE